MFKQPKTFLITSSLFAMLSIILSAFLGHMAAGKLNAYQMSIFQTGVFYQFIHSLALFGVGLSLLSFHHRLINLAGKLFILGILLFPGSLYIVSLFEIQGFGNVAPLGGLAFIIGWICLAVGISQSDSKSDKVENSDLEQDKSKPIESQK